MDNKLIEFLDRKVREFNQPQFIINDPISVPHRFSDKQDREIAGFFAAIFSWGNRQTIINKANELMRLMDDAPYAFCLNHSEQERKKLLHFKHRTFNTTDLLYFLDFLQQHYKKYDSLEWAFASGISKQDTTIENGLKAFYRYFFSLDHVPARTIKHISTPDRKSTCKRLNMFLRWMVRKDNKGVDFGIWKKIKPAQLVIPVDVHVARVSRSLKLINRKQTDWLTALELTETLKQISPEDPVKYDFALFALGANERF